MQKKTEKINYYKFSQEEINIMEYGLSCMDKLSNNDDFDDLLERGMCPGIFEMVHIIEHIIEHEDHRWYTQFNEKRLEKYNFEMKEILTSVDNK